jgi:hypothetical protein
VSRSAGPGKGGESAAGDVLELVAKDAAYSWWRNTHQDGYILSMRRRGAPLLHRARCPDLDPDRHPGRLNAAGSRQICSASKESLRAWLKAEIPEMTGMLGRCPKCGP